MAINFPTGATPNQIYSYNGLNWIYTGTYWRTYPQFTDILPLTGGTFSSGTTTFNTAIGPSFSVSGFTFPPIASSGVSYNNVSSDLTSTNVQDAITEIKPMIDYLPNAYHPFVETYSGVNGNVNGTKAYPIQIERTVKIDAVGVRIMTPVTGVTFQVAIYSNLQNFCYPNQLIVQTTTPFDGGVLNMQYVSIPTTTLKRGFYFVAVSFSNGTTGVTLYCNNYSLMVSLNTATFNFLRIWQDGNIYTSGFPSIWSGTTLGSSSNNNVPIIGFRVIN